MCDLGYADDPPELWTQTFRVARKEYRCSSCRGPILVGERYLRHFSKHDGDLHTGKACAACAAALEEFADAHDGMQPVPSWFESVLARCMDEDPDDGQRWAPTLDALRARRLAAALPSSASDERGEDSDGGGGRGA